MAKVKWKEMGGGEWELRYCRGTMRTLSKMVVMKEGKDVRVASKGRVYGEKNKQTDDM